MEQITMNEAIKDIKIQQLEKEIKQLKEIIAWQSFKMANIPVKKLKKERKVETDEFRKES